MPDEQSADLMMKLQLNGKDIIGEAMQWVDPKKDTTLEGFKPSPTPMNGATSSKCRTSASTCR